MVRLEAFNFTFGIRFVWIKTRLRRQKNLSKRQFPKQGAPVRINRKDIHFGYDKGRDQIRTFK